MWLIAVTGASGISRVKEFLKILSKKKIEFRVVLSEGAKRVFKEEKIPKIDDDIASPFASGSYKYEGMIIFPASMNTVAKIACGIADNLITRAAKVVLKEKRKLIVVFREAPLTGIDLENLLKIAREGGIIFPLVDQDYSDSEDYLAGRILDQMGIKHEYKRWGEFDEI